MNEEQNEKPTYAAFATRCMEDLMDSTFKNPHSLLSYVALRRGAVADNPIALRHLFAHAGRPAPRDGACPSRGTIAHLAFNAARRNGEGMVRSASLWLHVRSCPPRC